MTGYRANSDVAAYDAALADYETLQAERRDVEAQRQAEYEAAHEAWEQLGDTEAPEPQPPEPMPVDDPPSEPVTYESRDVTEFETIATPTGDALVFPPRVVLAAPGGPTFALSDDELAASFTRV
jgi:hypothetical protein